MNPWIIGGSVLLFALYTVGVYEKGAHDENAHWEAKVEEERADWEIEARARERQLQEKANAAIRKQTADLEANSARLQSQLIGLRNRPNRPIILPNVPRPTCEGATGSELSRADAEFLIREAARADAIRAGLTACYSLIDTVGVKP